MIVAVTGTGTGIGKTHLACALVGGLRDRGVRAVGWKPVESGVVDGATDTDEALLRAASGCDLPPTLRLRAPLSPHLAARREGRVIDGAAIRATLDTLAARFDVVVLELAGGLCSPFDDRIDNVDWLAQLGARTPDHSDRAQLHAFDAPGADHLRLRTILVAPDRLGVLHDVSAALRAAAAVDLDVHAIALVAPASPDDSTTTNADELRMRLGLALVEVSRAPIAELRRCAPLVDLGTHV